MEISRADISTEYIEDYRDAFMRVPIKAYLEEIDIEPLPSQIAVINGINNPKYRFGCAALSRRQGKTYIANVIGQVVSLVPGSNILVMAPNYSLSQISFDLQRSLIKRFQLEVTKDNAKDKVITMANGSSIRIGSVGQVDSCVGRSYDLIIFDEAALSAKGMDAFNVALRPTLDKPNSKALFISTPRGRNNWFAKLYDRGFSSEFPEWFSVKATYHDNPRMSASDVEEARKSMSEAEFRQEYEADFSMFEGKIWDLKAHCITDKIELNLDRCDIIAGLDLGYKDATAMCVIAYSWEEEKFYVLDEYINSELTTDKHAERIKRMIDRWNIDFIFIDSANQQQRFDLAQIYDIPTSNAKKSVTDGIGYIAALSANDAIVVDKSCTNVLNAFDQYQWDPNPNLVKEKPLHNEYSHMADAIRYAIYSYKVSSGGF